MNILYILTKQKATFNFHFNNPFKEISFNNSPTESNLLLNLIKSIEEELFHFCALVKDVSCELLHFVHLLCLELDDSL